MYVYIIIMYIIFKLCSYTYTVIVSSAVWHYTRLYICLQLVYNVRICFIMLSMCACIRAYNYGEASMSRYAIMVLCKLLACMRLTKGTSISNFS